MRICRNVYKPVTLCATFNLVEAKHLVEILSYAANTPARIVDTVDGYRIEVPRKKQEESRAVWKTFSLALSLKHGPVHWMETSSWVQVEPISEEQAREIDGPDVKPVRLGGPNF